LDITTVFLRDRFLRDEYRREGRGSEGGVRKGEEEGRHPTG
jgi:hypothetical protein